MYSIILCYATQVMALYITIASHHSTMPYHHFTPSYITITSHHKT